MSPSVDRPFRFGGVHHVSLVCRDMAKTVAFYRDLLGMKLLKTLDLPGDMGQHFFFDVGNGDSIAFFWFRGAAEAAPGIAAPRALPGEGNFFTAHGSMNHLAINVPAEMFDDYRERLIAKGVPVSRVLNHDHSESQISDEVTDDVYVRSIYFFDPDGIALEFAAWLRPLDQPGDVAHEPVNADGELAEPYLVFG
jgi:catechol 2,3-dioxygenase-like lactoylglutathione lyase family enzyme